MEIDLSVAVSSNVRGSSIIQTVEAAVVARLDVDAASGKTKFPFVLCVNSACVFCVLLYRDAGIEVRDKRVGRHCFMRPTADTRTWFSYWLHMVPTSMPCLYQQFAFLHFTL